MNVVILRKKQRLPGRRKRMKLRFMWGRKLNESSCEDICGYQADESRYTQDAGGAIQRFT